MIRAVFIALLALVAVPAAALDRAPPAQNIGPGSTLFGGLICAPGKRCDLSGISVTPSASAAAGTLGQLAYSPIFAGGLLSAGIAPLDMTYAGIINPNAVMLRPGNQVSICPALSCIYGPSNGTNVPAFYDHQRASLLVSSQTQDDAHSEEQTLAVTTTINTGLLKSYAASTAYAVGDNVMVGNAIYRAIQTGTGTTGANSAPPGTRPTSAPFTAMDGTVRWLWINDPAIASKVGAYVETSVGSGAGSAWGFVNNYQMQSGSVSANAVRFGAEFDFTNASGTDCALGIACDALRIGIGGTNKSTTALDITSANGSSYAAIWGQRFSGAYLASESLIALDANSKYGIAANQLGLGGDTFTGALILDNAASPAAIKSTKTHSTAWLWDQSSSPVGILLGGTYANNQIQGTGFSVSPTGAVSTTSLSASALATLNGGIAVNANGTGSAGSVNKIALFGTLNGTAYGWGVSAGSLDAVAPGGASHTFYVGPAAPLKVTGAGITVTGLTMPGQYTVANLPTCNASTKGGMAVATDVSAAPTYRQTGLTGGGSIAVPVFCNGSAYEAH